MNAMWSRDKPTEPGIYWLHLPTGDNAGNHLVSLKKTVEPCGDAYMTCRQTFSFHLEIGWSFDAIAEPPTDADELENDAEWFGPITPPSYPNE